MKDPKMNDLKHVETLAQIEANKTCKNQVIINSYDGNYKCYRFYREDQWNGKYVKLVRYTPKDKYSDVLRDNEDGKSATVKGNTGGKSKSGKIK